MKLDEVAGLACRGVQFALHSYGFAAPENKIVHDKHLTPARIVAPTLLLPARVWESYTTHFQPEPQTAITFIVSNADARRWCQKKNASLRASVNTADATVGV